jgi:tetratricopeptide (TPR) repeat protein
VKGNREAYLPALGKTLFNLAILYHDMGRLEEEQEAYRETLSIDRELSAHRPLPGVTIYSDPDALIAD